MKYETVKRLAEDIKREYRRSGKVPKLSCQILDEELMPKDARDRYRQGTIIDAELAGILQRFFSETQEKKQRRCEK